MAEANKIRSHNRRPKKNSLGGEVLKLCTAYLYRKDGCERGDSCNNLHMCRNYMLEQCRAGNSCTFSHDLQCGQLNAMFLRRYGLSLKGEPRRKFKSLFAATIRSTKDKATNESEESKAKNKQLNEEKLMNFLESFSDVEERVATEQSAKVVAKETVSPNTSAASHAPEQVPVATAREPPENGKSKNATPNTASDCQTSEKVSERPTSKKTSKVTKKKKATQNTVEGSQASGKSSGPTSSSADEEPLVMPSPYEKRLEICSFYLRGSCSSPQMKHGVYLHCLQRFQWQIQDARTKNTSWLDLSKQANSHLEMQFCDVNNKEYIGGIHVCGEIAGTVLVHVVTITFGKDSFTIQDGYNQVLDVRRLSTITFARAGGWRKRYSTAWIWYWKEENKKWREYPKQVPAKAGNSASSCINTLILERKYLDFKFNGKSPCYDFTLDGGQFRLNFSRMEQTCLEDHRVFEVARRPKYSTIEHPTNGEQSSSNVNESCASNSSADKHSDEPQPVAAPKKVNNDAASVEDVKETKSPKEEKNPREENRPFVKTNDAASSASQSSAKPKAVVCKTTPDATNFKGSSAGSCSCQPKEAGNRACLPKEPEAAVFMVKKPDVAKPTEVGDGALPSRDTDKLSQDVFRGPQKQDAVRPKETSRVQELPQVKPKRDTIDFYQLEVTLDKLKDGGTLSPEKVAEVQVILNTLVANLKKEGAWRHVPYSLRLKVVKAQNPHIEQNPDSVKRQEVSSSELKEEPTYSASPLNEPGASVSQKSDLYSPRSASKPVAASSSSSADVAGRRTSCQNESVYICTYFLRGRCTVNEVNYNHKRHYRQPYQWQIMDAGGQTGWQDLTQFENDNIEKLYCDVNHSLYSSRSDRHLHSNMTIQFDISPMTGCMGSNCGIYVQRLSTVSSVEKSNREKAFCTEWLWYWLDESQRWVVYSEQNAKGIKAGIDSSSIEQKYLDYESKMGAAKINFTAGGQNYELDFKAMQQKNIHYLTCRPVRRRPKFVEMAERKQESKRYIAQAHGGSVVVPTTWDNPKAQTDRVLVNITNFSSAEYINIANLFWDTMDDKATIISIQRVQNMELWEDFTKMSERMKKRNNGQPALQKQLFHGTQEKYADAISRQNFDWRLSGTTVGTLYGKGSYFARDASFSNSYTAPDADDCRYVFVSQVLVGETITGVSTYVRPPPKDRYNPHGELYDSCVNKMTNPEIYVVFEKTQVYPEYLIKYKLRSVVPASRMAGAGYTSRQHTAYTTGATPSYRSNSSSSIPFQNYTNPNPSSSSARSSPPPRRPSPTKKDSSCTIQ